MHVQVQPSELLPPSLQHPIPAGVSVGTREASVPPRSDCHHLKVLPSHGWLFVLVHLSSWWEGTAELCSLREAVIDGRSFGASALLLVAGTGDLLRLLWMARAVWVLAEGADLSMKVLVQLDVSCGRSAVQTFALFVASGRN